MDTNIPSPKLASSILTNTLSAAIAVGAVFLAVGAMSGVATAQTRGLTSETVSYADLNLSTHEGARALLKRIDYAAKRICGPAPSLSPLTPSIQSQYERCLKDAADNAVAQVNAPLVIALHTGEPQPVGEVFASR